MWLKSELLVHQMLGKQKGWAQGLEGQSVLAPDVYSTSELFDVYPELSLCTAIDSHPNLGFWEEERVWGVHALRKHSEIIALLNCISKVYKYI